MSGLSPIPSPLPSPSPLPRIEFCEDAVGLDRISDRDVDLAIWRRSLPEALADWIDLLDFDCLPSVRLFIRPSGLVPALRKIFDDCGTPGGEMRDLLLVDIQELAGRFADIAGTDRVDVRVEGIRHDACWKFHRDRVAVRLLTTYRGPGTEWVGPEWADAAIRDQKRFAGPIGRLQRHDVAVFKGSEADSARGIVHRSPPLSQLGGTRLFLCLNVPSESHG